MGGGDFDIYDSHSTARSAIGTRLVRQDGNEYVYGHFGVTVNRGVLVSTDVSAASLVETANAVIAPASAQTVTDGTIGSKFLEVTVAAISENQFAGGYLAISSGTGLGYTYRIKGNTATGSPAAGNIRIELNDKLQVALDATSDISIQGSLYSDLTTAASATDNSVAGVTVSSVIGGRYGWLLTKGVSAIFTAGTVATGDVVTLSAATAGAVEAYVSALVGDVENEEFLGTCLVVGSASAHGIYKVVIS